MAKITTTLQRHKVYPEKSTPEETRELAAAYRDRARKTQNETLRIMLNERATELDEEALTEGLEEMTAGEQAATIASLIREEK